ncbi:MAG: hypothetical protein KF693_05160 [Nitrospira sp.]|nr:hypothetical protein [Nitrospira sp.]
MNNPFVVPLPKKKKKKKPATPSEELRCSVCNSDQRVIRQWLACTYCDETLQGWDDASPETMQAWTRRKVWPSPQVGTA